MADPNRALFESVVRLLAPVLDELVVCPGEMYSAFLAGYPDPRRCPSLTYAQ